MEPYYEKFSGKAVSMGYHHIPGNIFSMKLWVIIRHSLWWQKNSFYRSWNLSPKFFKEIQTLLYLFKEESNKKQRRGRIISSFTKRETYIQQTLTDFNNQVLLGVISCCISLLAVSEKIIASSFSFMLGHLFKRGTYWFVLRAGRVVLIRTSIVERRFWTLY